MPRNAKKPLNLELRRLVLLRQQFGAAMDLSEKRPRCGTLSYQPPELFSGPPETC